MALAGLKKQFNKANQYMSEKMGAAEGTKLTDDFLEMERKTDATIELVNEMLSKTKELLQPNPATRAKMQLTNTVQGGGVRSHAYAQPEGLLGESMLRSARKLGDTNVFAQSLIEAGEALKQMAEVKYALEDSVKQNFLEPLTHLQNKEINDVKFHRKKLESRRLDFDCKKRRRPTSLAEMDDLNLARSKFEQSLNLAAGGMHDLLQNNVEHINQLVALTQALNEYHSQCATILDGLNSRLVEFKKEAACIPTETYVPKTFEDLKSANPEPDASNANQLPPPQQQQAPNQQQQQANVTNNKENARTPTQPHAINNGIDATAKPAVPSCRALYDFDANEDNELGFKEGDIIELKEKIDDNWFQGSLHDRTGIFPISYVTVLIPLSE